MQPRERVFWEVREGGAASQGTAVRGARGWGEESRGRSRRHLYIIVLVYSCVCVCVCVCMCVHAKSLGGGLFGSPVKVVRLG